MTPLGNLVFAVAQVLDIAINLMFLLLLARVVVSWVMPGNSHPLVQTLYAITEPLLFPIRQFIQRFTGHIAVDFSPIVAFLGLTFIQSFVVHTLFQLAQQLTF